MNTTKNDMMKYVGAAIAIGGSMLLGSGIVKENKTVRKKMKKTATKALDTVDSIISGMQSIVK
ncbi:MAG: hypothetical protein IKL10_10230 [Clostridia bacterium]|nr:hypothetical protein [Clostridia bacterium]